MASPLVIARHQENELALLPALANRHGLITGATGTGKTITLQVLAERFSSIGVPVFMADVKGDLSGLAAPGVDSPKLKQRLDSLGVSDWAPAKFPAAFWDVSGAQGHPVRATISDMGPILLSRLLTVAPAIVLLRRWRAVPRGTIRILTWGGLRGGVSVALALALPLGPERDLILSITYIVVLSSILFQGLTIGKLVKHVNKDTPVSAEADNAH